MNAMSQNFLDQNSMLHKDFQFVCLNHVRFVLAIIVVLIHTFFLSSTASFADTTCPFIESVNRVLVAFLAPHTVVPVYFFISGYLFFLVKEWNKNVYLGKVRKRMHTLLIPYLLWNGVGIILIVIKQLPCFDTFISLSGTNLDLSIQNILSCFYMYNGKLCPPSADVANYAQIVQAQSYPINTALWYIRDLMFVVICTPILHFLLKKLKACLLISMSLLYVLLDIYHADYHLYQLTTAFLFFSCGALMSLSKMNLLDVFGKIFYFSIILYPLCSLVYLFYSNDNSNIAVLLKTLNMFLFIIFAINLTSLVLRRVPQLLELKNVNALGVFIYLAHCLFLPRILKVALFIVTPDTNMEMVICYICAFLSTILLLTGIYFLLQKYKVSVLDILIGRANN